jgi:predicted dinucleotide-binding enzyme
VLCHQAKVKPAPVVGKQESEMKIAIIGSGNVGRALGGSFARAGQDVTLVARDPDHAGTAAAEIGVAAAASVADAARDADVLVLAVPYTAVEDLVAELDGAAAGKVLIDATNPLRGDYSGLSTAGEASGAEHLAELFPGARVVKAFNTLFAAAQADPATHGTTLDALYATDDDEAAAVVATLATAIGFRPVRVGPLAAARELEAAAWLNIRLQMLSGGDWRSAFVLVGAPLAAVA